MRGEFGDALGNSSDDGAQFGVAICILLAELFRIQVNFREQALKAALEGFGFDVFEACLLYTSCATLAWHAVRAALEEHKGPVATE